MGYKNIVLGVKIDRRISGKTSYLEFKDKTSLNVVVTNLLDCMDGTSILLYSRDKSRTMKWKHNPDCISNYRIMKAVGWLEQEGYVVNTIASAFQLYEDMRDMSYCVPTLRFNEKFNIAGISEVAKKARLDAVPVLLLRDKNGELKYRNSKQTVMYENAMRLMNTNNSKFDVTDENFDSVDTIYSRIFRESFDINGRMYSVGVHGIENRKSKGRLKLHIDSKNVVEIDFNAMFLNLLADRYGHISKSGDGYMNMLPEDMKCSVNRQVVKLCFLRLLNCPSQRSALLSFRDPMDEAIGHTFKSPSHVMMCILEYIGTLAEHLYTKNLGLILTYIESSIMSDVVQLFVSLEKPILPIHDSAVVLLEDKELLATTMSDFYRQHMDVDRVVSLTCSRFDGVLIKEDCSC